MATTVARLEAILSAQTRDFDRAMDKSHANLNKVGKAAGVAGLAIAAGLGVVAKVGFDEMQQGLKATAQTNAVLKSTGNVAHVTAGHINELARSLMSKSGVDDQAIQSGENMLLTFKNIRNEAGANNKIFDQSSKVLLDMTVAMNGGVVNSENMRKAAIQMGKAMNDPIAGLTALKRVGVTFTDQQKQQIKALVEGGHSMEAQKIILRELNSEFGGSANALGKTLPGQINIAKQTFRNLAADLVTNLLPTFTAITSEALKVTRWLSAHPHLARVLAVALGVLAGALLAARAAQLLMNLAVLANPYVAATVAVIALGVAIYVFRDKIRNTFNWIKEHWPLLVEIIAGPIGLAVVQISKHFNDIVNFTEHVPGRIGSAILSGAKAIKNAVTNLFGKVIGWVKGVLGISSPSSVFHDIGQNVVKGFVNGVGSMAGVLKHAVTRMVGDAAHKLGTTFGIITPSVSLKDRKGLDHVAKVFGNKALGKAMAKARYGWSGAQFDALDKLWTQESGWSQYAKNASSGAYGIPQALPPTKMPFAAQEKGGSSPSAQIAWGLAYIHGTYGNPINAWNFDVSHGMKGYASGGIVHGPGMTDTVPAMLTPGEMVLNRQHQNLLGGQELLARALGFAKGGIVPGKDRIDPEASRGLDLMKRAWAIVGPTFFGHGGSMPNFKLTHGTGLPFVDGFISRDGKIGNVLESIPISFLRMVARGVPSVLNTVIHEWAHVFQKKRWESGIHLNSEQLFEGGAITFAQDHAQDVWGGLGMGYKLKPESRAWWRGPILDNLGRGWAAMHQFALPPGFRPPNVYDKGGWLQPGLTLAMNATGQPERVIAPGQGGDTVIVQVGAEEVARVVFDHVRGKAQVFQRRNNRPAFGV